MVDDDGRAGKGAGEVDQVGKLRMEVPGIEAQPERAELGEAFAECRVEQAVRWNSPGDMLADHAVVMRGAVAYAAKAAAAGLDLGLQHLAHAGTQHQVGPADDRLAD